MRMKYQQKKHGIISLLITLYPVADNGIPYLEHFDLGFMRVTAISLLRS